MCVRNSSASHRATRPESGATTIEGVAEFIYTMQKVRKAHGDKVILDDVTLNFLPGAKIGVVGPNGAGKSTVLKIMAGLEHPNNGEAYLQPGATVGILQQEPPLTEEKTVLGNVEEGLGEIKSKLDRYNAIAEYEPSRAATACMVSASGPDSSARPIAAVTIGSRPSACLRGGGSGWAQISRTGPPSALRTT